MKLLGFMAIFAALWEALSSKKGHETIGGIIEGFKTSKKDLKVNWKVLEKYEKKT